MALHQPVRSVLACADCQQWLLRSFTGLAITMTGAQRPPVWIQQRSIRQRARPSRRTIQLPHRDTMDDGLPLNDINDTMATLSKPSPRQNTAFGTEQPIEDELPGKEDEANTPYRPYDSSPSQDKPLLSTQPNLPWYLQPTSHPDLPSLNNPLAARQRLPDLPRNPPPLLEPLLNHISVELGLDDLTLLDLRSLDPPPALGANLLMIIGTARSEKHLHVSADRLCRWLRTTYKLRPYADGLLGRGELKLKMRRKAKRSRLMSAVGAKSTGEEEMDDGIRTGWVCVNVGRVEGGEVRDGEEVGREVVGFGTGSGGCNVVVQMLTEEKRGDVDLEGLWGEVVRKAEKEKVEAMDGESQEASGASEVGVQSAASTGAMAFQHTGSSASAQLVA